MSQRIIFNISKFIKTRKADSTLTEPGSSANKKDFNKDQTLMSEVAGIKEQQYMYKKSLFNKKEK